MNLNVRDGIRCSPADAYLGPVMANQNLTVLNRESRRPRPDIVRGTSQRTRG